MTEQEMSMDEILSSIRQILTQEVGETPSEEEVSKEKPEDIFVLTPEMRCDTADDLKERMQRVLDKMAHQETKSKKQTVTQELQPLLKDWLIQMRPDLKSEQIQQEVRKILPDI